MVSTVLVVSAAMIDSWFHFPPVDPVVVVVVSEAARLMRHIGRFERRGLAATMVNRKLGVGGGGRSHRQSLLAAVQRAMATRFRGSLASRPLTDRQCSLASWLLAGRHRLTRRPDVGNVEIER